MKTEAVVIGLDSRARLLEVDLPRMTDTRVRVQTLVSGVSCGTEADSAGGRAAYIQRPFISGYQAVGTVLEIGTAVTGFLPGDLVVTTGGALWDTTNLFGGSHTRQSIAEAAALVKLGPATPSLETASYAVLAAVAGEGLSQARLDPGKILAVFGLGMLGQLAGSIGRLRGLRVIGVNRSEWKRAAAKKAGFDATCPPQAAAIHDAVASLGGKAIDLALDTTGNQEMFDLAVQILGKGGDLILDGYYPEKFTVDFDLCHSNKSLRIHNPVGYGDQLPEIVRLIEDGQLNISPLITHRIHPGQVTEFYADLIANHSRFLGAVIDWRTSGG